MNLTDSYREDLIRELRAFRKGSGQPAANRMASLFYLTESLGEGVQERAFDELTRLQQEFGGDPMTPVGAFFFLSGWGVGLGSVDERRRLYVNRHYAGDVSTPWRRSEKGIRELVALIESRDEWHRPTGFIGLVPGPSSFQAALGFDIPLASWVKPSVYVNDEEYDLDDYANVEIDQKGKLGRQYILPFVPLDTSVGASESMGTVRVKWLASTWPVWSVMSWLDDPRTFTQIRTFANRSIEVSLRSSNVAGEILRPTSARRLALMQVLARWQNETRNDLS